MSVADESDAEMRLYDELGPIARAAIGHAHRCLDIESIVRAFKQDDPRPIHLRAKLPLVLTDPAVDRRLADKIDKIVQGDAGKPISDLTLRRRRVLTGQRRFR